VIEALDEAIALAPELADEFHDVAEGAPSAPPQDDAWGPVGTEAAMVPLVDDASDSASSLDPAAEVKAPARPRVLVALRQRATSLELVQR
jgi:hypothetical protein